MNTFLSGDDGMFSTATCVSSQTAGPMGGGIVGESLRKGVNSAMKRGAITRTTSRPGPEGDVYVRAKAQTCFARGPLTSKGI